MCIQIGLKYITVLILLGFVECALKVNAFKYIGTQDDHTQVRLYCV